MAAKRKAQPEPTQDVPVKLDTKMFFGMELDPEQEKFASAIWSPDYDIIFCNAKAGTGKTTIAAGTAVLLSEYGIFQNIIYIVSPYGERKQGYLPGSFTEKSSVYFEAFWQALISCNVNPNTAINTESMVNQKNGTGFITCITDTFLRGTNLDNAVVILDEAQNFSVSQLKKVLTRIGSHTKVIVIGHDMQCDMEDQSKSGFVRYMKHFESCDRAAFCSLSQNYRGWISRHADEFVD